MSSTVDPCLAVVPARGGSKGLPGKNIRPFCGVPLLVHALRCAERVPRLARVVVSTDSEEIAGVVRQAGGQVAMRPAELARDDTPTMPVLQHVLAEQERADGRSYASLLLLEPTSPGRLPEDLERTLQTLDADPDADGVVACSMPPWNPFYVGVVERDGYLANAFEQTYTRRQDVPRFLRINGAAYAWRAGFVRRSPPDWSVGRHRAVEIPDERAFSIDTRDEFELAELIVKSGRVVLPWLS